MNGNIIGGNGGGVPEVDWSKAEKMASNFTVTKSGFAIFSWQLETSGVWTGILVLKINNLTLKSTRIYSGRESGSATLPVRKGDVITHQLMDVAIFVPYKE